MKKQFLLLVLLLIPLSLFAIGKKNDKADNTESYVNSLSEEDFVKGNSCSKGTVRRNSINNKTSITTSRFNGVDCIATVNPKNQIVELTISCKVSKGDLRLILCDSENIVYEFEVNEKDQIYNIPFSSSKYYLKVAGENANYSVEIEYKAKTIDLPTFESSIL